jgi:hypothetical protein
MDIGAMKADLKKALDSLPKGMINPRAVAVWLNGNRKQLETIVPDIIELMKPHLMAGVMEASMGVLDQNEIEEACVSVLLTYGVAVNADGG